MMNIKKYNLQYLSRKTKKTLGCVIDYYAYKKGGTISLYFFSKEKNVGDILNPYLVGRLFNISCIQRQKGRSPNLLAIGSVMHEATLSSYIWGSGFISRKDLPKKLDPKKIKALRGALSVELLNEKYGINLGDLPLGDPAILMPLVYKPKTNKKYKIGIVAHYVDKDKIPESIHSNPEIKLIDVQQDPESFVDDLMECSHIVSSSLHGLILADTYGIPNKWIVLSDRLVGGDFKFNDYYSTTKNPDEKGFAISNSKHFSELMENIESYTSIKDFNLSKEALLDSFPIKEL